MNHDAHANPRHIFTMPDAYYTEHSALHLECMAPLLGLLSLSLSLALHFTSRQEDGGVWASDGDKGGGSPAAKPQKKRRTWGLVTALGSGLNWLGQAIL